MSKRDLFEVAVGILGLYLLLMFLMVIPGVLMALTQNDSLYFSSISSYAVLCSSPILYLVFGVACLLKGPLLGERLFADTNAEPEAERESLPTHCQLSFWMILVGVYLMISSSPTLLEHLLRLSIQLSEGSEMRYWWLEITGEGLTVIFSLILIFRSNRIETFIQDRSQQGS